jgi:DNA sulfur modification protein DndC
MGPLRNRANDGQLAQGAFASALLEPDKSTCLSANERAHKVRAALREHYVADSRPWVVAYSGGKDSTLVLQLVIEMLRDLRSQATKPVYVISSDTRVEAPQIVAYVEKVLAALGRFAREQHLPVRAELVRPNVEQGFWAKLIGLGYPPPTRWFRWCTSNMKIKPSRAKIAEITSIYGSVILLLGSREQESQNRARAMAARAKNDRGLNPHHQIPNAFVLAPIADWETDDVWEYLFEHNPPPWPNPHDEMLSLYRQASGGECPVVMDLNTPSCGGSRFGCWTCTVVKLDRSMEGFVQSGAAWLQPLNDFRNWLKEIRELPEWRQTTRRSGEPGIGPFTPAARERILRRLLELEREVGISLIEDEDIAYIQAVWSQEFDLSGRRAVDVGAEFGRVMEGPLAMKPLERHRELVEEIAARNEVPAEVLDSLLGLENEFQNLHAWGAKANLKSRISEIVERAIKQSDEA